MRKMFCYGMILFMSFPAWCQDVRLEKGRDTIYVGEKDSTVVLSFKIEGTTAIDGYPELSIRINSGPAAKDSQLVLKDAYDANTSEIRITRIENKSGKFSVRVAGGLKQTTYVNLQITLFNGAVPKSDILKIVLMPLSKKAVAQESVKPEKKDSLKFVQHNSINIPVYKQVGKPLKIKLERRWRKDLVTEEFVNLLSFTINQTGTDLYRIQVFTTEKQRYAATIQLNSDYQFIDDKLYLNGRKGDSFIYASDIFLIEVDKAGEVSKSASPATPEVKFKL